MLFQYVLLITHLEVLPSVVDLMDALPDDERHGAVGADVTPTGGSSGAGDGQLGEALLVHAQPALSRQKYHALFYLISIINPL